MHLQTRSIRAARARLALVFIVGLLSSATGTTLRAEDTVHNRVRRPATNQSLDAERMPAVGMLEVAFAPNADADGLVVRVIKSARREILVLAHSFTSPSVTRALAQATRRGIVVRIVADRKANLSDAESGPAGRALSTLKRSGVDVRVIDTYPAQNDKVIIVDRETVQLGSFNYSKSAAQRNSDNALAIWGNPKLAQSYVRHFQRNYRQAKPLPVAAAARN